MKNPNDPIGNRTRDLPACSAVPQPAAPNHKGRRLYISWLSVQPDDSQWNMEWFTGTWSGLGLAFLIVVMSGCPPLRLPLTPRQDVLELHVAAEIKLQGLIYLLAYSMEQSPS